MLVNGRRRLSEEENRPQGGLVQAENDFDRSGNGRRLAIRAHSRTEAPSANRFDCLFIEAHAEAFGNADVCRASIGGNDGHQQHRTLIFCL